MLGGLNTGVTRYQCAGWPEYRGDQVPMYWVARYQCAGWPEYRGAGLLITVCHRTNSGQNNSNYAICRGKMNSEPWVKNCISQNVLSILNPYQQPWGWPGTNVLGGLNTGVTRYQCTGWPGTNVLGGLNTGVTRYQCTGWPEYRGTNVLGGLNTGVTRYQYSAYLATPVPAHWYLAGHPCIQTTQHIGT